jgi:hypothetical protein
MTEHKSQMDVDLDNNGEENDEEIEYDSEEEEERYFSLRVGPLVEFADNYLGFTNQFALDDGNGKIERPINIIGYRRKEEKRLTRREKKIIQGIHIDDACRCILCDGCLYHRWDDEGIWKMKSILLDAKGIPYDFQYNYGCRCNTTKWIAMQMKQGFKHFM